jgi:hypothetical protein
LGAKDRRNVKGEPINSYTKEYFRKEISVRAGLKENRLLFVKGSVQASIKCIFYHKNKTHLFKINIHNKHFRERNVEGKYIL